jgi:hypothetical protein
MADALIRLTLELTGRRRNRALAANPAPDELAYPNSQRGAAAVRVKRTCSAKILSCNVQLPPGQSLDNPVPSMVTPTTTRIRKNE